MESDSRYKLRTTLRGHSKDIRGVAAGITKEDTPFIVSGSRDQTSKVWMLTVDENFVVAQTLEGHKNFVSCVTILPQSKKYPNGLIITGSNDNTALAFEIGKSEPVFRLIGHTGTVCSISTSNTTDGLIITGSWDSTAIVWNWDEKIYALSGHAQAVWAVAGIPDKRHLILTGSADHEVRLWNGKQTQLKFLGHTDCVRDIAVLEGNRFISCGNDAKIIMWNMTTADIIQTFFGHSNFIYKLAVLPGSDRFASVGEDRSLRLWRDTEIDCTQVIFLPATSIWCVAAMANGDIVTGSSDGAIRVFTSDEQRIAPPEALKEFEDSVSNSTIAAQQELGGMKISELPGPEALYKPGKKDGDTKMVREGASVVCYSWIQTEQRWNKIGDVVGASGATPNTSGKTLFEGKEYDYVFNVELDDHKMLKLPFNITEDPWFAAQKFLERNDLSQHLLDTVAEFIVKNTKGVELAAPAVGFDDPFTGGNRYIPGAGSSSQHHGNNIGGLDPFTGGGAYSTQFANNSTEFPVVEFIKFTSQPNRDSVKSKLIEFIESTPNCSLDTRCVPIILRLGTADCVWDDTLETVLRLALENFPKEMLFPILDLLRIAVLDPKIAESFKKRPSFSALLGTTLNQGIVTNQMLILRMLNNLFGIETEFLMVERSEIISRLLHRLVKGKLNEIAASTLLLNYSIVTAGLHNSPVNFNNETWANSESRTEVLSAILSLIDFVDEPEGTYRLLVGIGNLIHDDPSTAELFKSLEGVGIIENYKANGALPKIKTCAKQISDKLN